MPQPLSGPGLGLPLPQYLYPTELFSAPYDQSSNLLTLAPGDAIPIPAGTWFISKGLAVIQILDPITNIWRGLNSALTAYGYVKSDGFTLRLANLTGCPVAAVVANGGSAYVQASTTVVPTVGSSTWQPIVGGQVSLVSVAFAGSGYGVAPLVFIPAPPQGGVPATAFAVISAGTVASVTFANVGAGYPTAPVATILPNPTDPNINSGISQATLALGLTSSGKITAVLCTNPGAPLATISALSLTAAGVGTGATITPVVMQQLTGISVAGGGFGFPSGSAELTTVSGQPAAGAFTNPAIEETGYIPRPARVTLTTVAGSITALGAIIDPGLFLNTPTAIINSGGTPTSTSPSISLTMGSGNATVMMQPAP